MSNYILAQVRELIGRNLDPLEIARRLHISVLHVEEALVLLKH
jgi:hypothetical protein